MAEAEEVRRPGELTENPLLHQLIVVKMEKIMDRLKLMNYEEKFCKKFKFPPFPRHYFAMSTNPGEQFFSFSNLAVWFLTKIGKRLEQPQEVAATTLFPAYN